MKRYLLAGALAGAACCPAYAITLNGETFTATETYGPSQGGPSITGQETNGHAFTLSVGGAGITFNAFTLNPAGSCSGGGCVGGSGGTETDPITFTITGLTDTLGPFSQTGKFEAKYSGSEIGCAVGDAGSGAGQSDCFLWGNTTAYNQSVTQMIALTGALQGDDLEVVFHNAADWSITPTVTLSLVDGVPEPSTWAMLIAGFGLMGAIGWRKARLAA